MATKQEIISGIEFLIQESKRMTASLTPDQWAKVVDLDGWKNQEVLAHISSIGTVVVPMASGFANAAAGADALAGANIDAMNAAFVSARAGKTAAELTDEVATSYAGVIEWLRNAPDDLLAKRTTAMGYKDVPVSDLLMRMVVMHGIAHIYSVYSGIMFGRGE
jgi:MFS superfamily sulfate permease-like transporter